MLEVGLTKRKSRVFQKEVLDWFEKYGDIHRLKTIKQQNELPLMITVDAQNYLDEI